MKFFWAILLILLPIALIFSEGSMSNLQTVSIIAAFPIGLVIILIIATLIRGLMKFAGVKAFLGGIRPCVIGLIIATAISMFMSVAIGFGSIGDTAAIDIKGIIIFAILIAVSAAARFVFKKKISPILMILISAGLGMLMY